MLFNINNGSVNKSPWLTPVPVIISFPSNFIHRVCHLDFCSSVWFINELFEWNAGACAQGCWCWSHQQACWRQKWISGPVMGLGSNNNLYVTHRVLPVLESDLLKNAYVYCIELLEFRLKGCKWTMYDLNQSHCLHDLFSFTVCSRAGGLSHVLLLWLDTLNICTSQNYSLFPNLTLPPPLGSTDLYLLL